MQDDNSGLYCNQQSGQAQGNAASDFRCKSGVCLGFAEGNLELVLSRANPGAKALATSNLLPADGCDHAETVDFEFVSGPALHAQCVREIMAFVRGGRVGLDRLRHVFPSIAKEFHMVDPCAVLIDCGLVPMQTDDGVPTFFFQIDRDGEILLAPKRQAGVILMQRIVIQEETDSCDTPVVCSQSKLRPTASEMLALAYADASSSWSVPR